MKLIYIANSRIPTEKANGFQIMKMCEGFSQSGYRPEVILVIPNRFNEIKENPFQYYRIRPSFEIKKLPTLDLIPLAGILGPIANLIESISFSIFTIFYLKKQKPDLIYSRDQFTLWFLSFFKNKFVFEIHSFPRRTSIYKRIWYKACKIVTITQGLKDLIIKQFKSTQADVASKILVAHDAVDLSAFKAVIGSSQDFRIDLGLPQNNFLIGFIGKFRTLDMEKGISTMIDALSLLDKNQKMVFVGGSEEEIKFYRSYANKKNVLSQCLFFGHQPYEKVIKFIKAMDVLVIPFPNRPHYAFYASPLKLFEYMASGRPIIVSDLPALREVLNEKNAIFFKPEDADDLVRAIKMFASSQMLAYHLSQQALSDVEEYTWHKRAEKILEFTK